MLLTLKLVKGAYDNLNQSLLSREHNFSEVFIISEKMKEEFYELHHQDQQLERLQDYLKFARRFRKKKDRRSLLWIAAKGIYFRNCSHTDRCNIFLNHRICKLLMMELDVRQSCKFLSSITLKQQSVFEVLTAQEREQQCGSDQLYAEGLSASRRRRDRDVSRGRSSSRRATSSGELADRYFQDFVVQVRSAHPREAIDKELNRLLGLDLRFRSRRLDDLNDSELYYDLYYEHYDFGMIICLQPPTRNDILHRNHPSDQDVEITDFLLQLQHRDITPEDYDLLLKLDERVSKKTLSMEVLSGFPRRLITNVTEGDSCSICQEDYLAGDSVMKLPVCGHEFHEDCITSWLTESDTNCPLDKLDVMETTC